MTSDPFRARRVFVWTWLPGESEPVVAGASDTPRTIHRL